MAKTIKILVNVDAMYNDNKGLYFNPQSNFNKYLQYIRGCQSNDNYVRVDSYKLGYYIDDFRIDSKYIIFVYHNNKKILLDSLYTSIINTFNLNTSNFKSVLTLNYNVLFDNKNTDYNKIIEVY